MGINSLLPALKTIVKPRKISDYANCKVAVDTYCWLHKALYSCATDMMEGRQTDEYVRYCLRKVDSLLHWGIRVVMVFDGGRLPIKGDTEESREKKRTECQEKARQLLLQGERDKAIQKYSESIDVTPAMANRLLQALRERNIECIVAPYEADAQLAYLSLTNYVDVIITEDSDLLAFGAKRIFYKMDRNGLGQEISLEDLPLCSEYSFANWTNNMFLTLCIMAGCDYLEQIPKVGFKTAFNQIARLKNYRLVISHFMQSGKYQVTDDYLKGFERAFLTFRFQVVFDPVLRRATNLNDIQMAIQEGMILEPSMASQLSNQTDLDYLGKLYDCETACQIADGIICPVELTKFPECKIPQYQPKIMKDEINYNEQQIKSSDQQMFGNQQKQVFLLAKPKASGHSSKQKQGSKQTNLDSYFKKKQKNVHPLLQESESQQPPQHIQQTKLRPFKSPTYVGGEAKQQQLEQQFMQTQIQGEEQGIPAGLSWNNLLMDDLPVSQSSSDDLMIKGIDGIPLILDQELLQRRINFDCYAEYMAEQITFQPTFEFNY